MKVRLNHVLTRREKTALILLCMVCLAAAWYVSIYRPIRARMQMADLETLETEILIEQSRALKIVEMQNEIAENRAAGVPVVPSYNHFKEETEELNRIFSQAYEFDFRFSEPVTDGMKIRRNVAVSFEADSYDAAVRMVQEVLQGPYRSQLRDLNIFSKSQVYAQQEENIKNGRVSVSFLLTYFETRYDSDTEEGLKLQEKHS